MGGYSALFCSHGALSPCSGQRARTQLAPTIPVQRAFSILLVAGALSSTSAFAQDLNVTGLNSLAEVDFSALSQSDPNPLGQKALAIHPDQWKHGESEHFIYHFVHSYVATPVSVEAEFHYRVVAKELEREQASGNTKSHVYIFEK